MVRDMFAWVTYEWNRPEREAAELREFLEAETGEEEQEVS